jgi:hypothetical protein
VKKRRNSGEKIFENRDGPNVFLGGTLLRAAVAVAWLACAGCGILQIPREATAAVEEWRDRTGDVDPCRVNAMQHCVAASATAAVCGAPCAVALGRLLEIVQDDGDPMDLHNNAAGADCAAQIAGDDADAVGCCEHLLNAAPSGLSLSGFCG